MEAGASKKEIGSWSKILRHNICGGKAEMHELLCPSKLNYQKASMAPPAADLIFGPPGWWLTYFVTS